jgi:hypothetical protein
MTADSFAQNHEEAFASSAAFSRWWRKMEAAGKPTVPGLIRVRAWLNSDAFVNLSGEARKKTEMGIYAAVALVHAASQTPSAITALEEAMTAATIAGEATAANGLARLIGIARKTPCKTCPDLHDLPTSAWGGLLNYWWAEYLATHDPAAIERLIDVLAYFPPSTTDRSKINAALSALDMLTLAARQDTEVLEICRAVRETTTNEIIADLLRLVIDASKREKKPRRVSKTPQ